MPDDHELNDLIAGGESDRVEFKASARDLDKIRQAICAFANDLPNHGAPGFIFIGLNDDGTCSDLAIDDQLLQTLGGLSKDGKTLPFPTLYVEKRMSRDCEIAVVRVDPSENPPVKVDGRCWIRTGPRRGQASPDEERRLTEKRRYATLPYDMQGVSGSSVDRDIDVRLFEEDYLPFAVSPEALEENERERQEQMRALRLIAPEGLPTATAILVLGKDPGGWFPGSYIQFVRYDGENVTDPIKDQKEIRGTLTQQLRQIDEILKVHISTGMQFEERHRELPDYPAVALRELIRNAVIHRNYENSNTPVRVSWFSDRVQIVNPGPTYGEVTQDNLGDPGITAYRNPTIAEAMKSLGFMERFGTGIQRARAALRDNGNPSPEFAVEDPFVSVTVGAGT